jgi:amino acid transporter
MEDYKKNSITLKGAVGLGTGVMISAGIFALLGQVAELSGSFFPLMFIIGGIITGFSAYSYIKMSNKFPSAGGIGMFFVKLYGKGTITASASLLMAFSMVINQSLVARTFGTYTLQLFDGDQEGYLIPLLGVILLAFAFIINILSNKFIETFTSLVSLLKILGLVLFSIVGLSVSNFSFNVAESTASVDPSIIEYVGALALTILAFKGFTTITNSGSEIKNPHRNVGIAIIISISICVIVYVLLAWAVASNLSINEIINAKDYALAEAAKPAFGVYGLWFTVGLAIIATITGIIASVFAVSRMLAMLTDMQLIPHKHFGMPGNIQKHTLVYTIVIAMALTVLFDLSRIASLGAIYYLIMDIIFHWGVFQKLHKKINANPYIVLFAICFDTIVLLAFIWIKASTDFLLIGVALVSILLIFIVEKFFLRAISTDQKQNI